MSGWIYLPRDEYAPAQYPEPLGTGLHSAPVFCWVSNAWCPYVVLRHWQSKAENQPHKWYVDKGFYPPMFGNSYPLIEFGGEVHAWCPLPERPKEIEQMRLFGEKA